MFAGRGVIQRNGAGRLVVHACAVGACGLALAAPAGAVEIAAGAARPAVPPVHGYDAHWLFNANDGEPIAKVTVARNGTFSFSYRPSYCGTGSFRFHGAFLPQHGSYLGTPGYVVSMTVTGSCDGRGQSAGNYFTWSKVRAISVFDRWPDSRSVQGELDQTAVAGTARGDLDIDLNMSAS